MAKKTTIICHNQYQTAQSKARQAAFTEKWITLVKQLEQRRES